MNPFQRLFGTKTARSEKRREPEAIEIEQEEMIEGIEQLAETTVKEVMVPRTDTVFVSADADADELFEILIQSGHSRIPVYRESIDDVIGVLYAKDVLAALIEKKDIKVSALARKPFFVPETKRIDSLLREFKRRRVHIAVVLDEYGGTSGIVCMEDIIEEIVGEIQDEYDNEAEDFVQTGPDTWLCDARTRLEEIGEAAGIDLPDEEFDSLAGYVFELFGRIPAEGEQVSTELARFTVQKMEAHRIISIKVEKLARSKEEAEEKIAEA